MWLVYEQKGAANMTGQNIDTLMYTRLIPQYKPDDAIKMTSRMSYLSSSRIRYIVNCSSDAFFTISSDTYALLWRCALTFASTLYGHRTWMLNNTYESCIVSIQINILWDIITQPRYMRLTGRYLANNLTWHVKADTAEKRYFFGLSGTPLTKRINCSMDRWLHPLWIVWWNYLSIPRLQNCMLRMDK